MSDREDPPCINLRAYSPPYRVHNELEGRPAYERDNAWDLVIQGSGGFVAPQGGEFLLACTRHRLTTNAILAKVPDAVVMQDGSDGQNVKFAARHLDTVAGILGLRRRRQLSEEQKAALAEANAPYRFRPPSSSRLPARMKNAAVQ
jgi:hypothetical protein